MGLESLAGPTTQSLGDLASLVERLGAALPPTTEIILHDFSNMSATVVAVSGSVTGRRVGDPPTDLLLSHVANGAERDLYYYRTVLPDGRELSSSTIVVRSVDGEPIGAICVNNDLSPWRSVAELAAMATQREQRAVFASAGPDEPDVAPAAIRQTPPDPGGPRPAVGAPQAPATPHSEIRESFPRSIGELANTMVARSIESVGLPVSVMRKKHKMAIVADLRARGIFQLRESVDEIAAALQVSRFTIYKYLNELEDHVAPEGGNDGASEGDASSGPATLGVG
ncbi:transcriptional regulator [Pimelobacter sp. 30-1]|uniref:helix-turn-helix transcriptional regulator n=1 Tax=Pimelobacter sp. 30-1 TaxID=2004991 RepID=UPI001C053D86|nr:PAS domain-containing protein [Pimelobacter sp. 30-1]